MNNVQANEIRSPLQATVVQWLVQPGDTFQAGDVVAVLEAMKMEHEVRARAGGRVTSHQFSVGDLVDENDLLLISELSTQIIRDLEPDFSYKSGEAALATKNAKEFANTPTSLRPDLQRVIDRHAFTLDANRAPAVTKRHALKLRTARENIADLCDLDGNAAQPGNFIEYGALALAAQTRRRSLDDLIANTPGDGMVTGIGSVNFDKFGEDKSRCVVMAYDFTVLAGTQGMRNHQKTDRLLELALHQKLPVVLFAEGGGGRPGDVDSPKVRSEERRVGKECA